MANTTSHLGILSFIGLLIAPFLYFSHPAPLPSFPNEWLAGICLLGTLSVLLPIGMKKPPLEIPIPTAFLAGMILLLILQISTGQVQYPGQGILAILYLIAVILLTLSTRSLVLTRGLQPMTTILAWSLLLTGILGSCIAIIQHWEIHSWLDAVITQKSDWRAFGNIGQANHFGDIEMLAAAALIYLSATKRIAYIAAVLLAVALALGLILSASRSIWLYFIVITILGLITHKKLQINSSSRIIFWTLILLTAFLLFQLGFNHSELISGPNSHVATRLATTQDNSIGVRLAFLDEAWHTFLDNPILGAGYEQFSWQHFLRQATSPNLILSNYENTYASNAHNLIFQMLAEFGLAGFAILAGLLIWLTKQFKNNPSPEQWLIYAMLGIILSHSLVEYPLYYLYFLAPFAILLTLASSNSISVIPSRWAALASPLILIIGITILAVMLISFQHLQQAYGGTSQKIVLNSEARYHLIQASEGGFFEPEIDHLLNIIPVGLGDPAERKLQLEISERSMRHRPTGPKVYRHAFLLAINGRSAKARQFILMARKAYPNHLSEFSKQVDSLLYRHPDNTELRALHDFIREPM